MSDQAPPAGWYPHPNANGGVRYWDGKAWTDHFAPKPPTSNGRNIPDGLITAGYVTMILFPIVGAVIGIIALTKGESKAGGVMLAVSLAVITVVLYAATNNPEALGNY